MEEILFPTTNLSSMSGWTSHKSLSIAQLWFYEFNISGFFFFLNTVLLGENDFLGDGEKWNDINLSF